ncbi:hypothetical protein [Pelomonas cellulosilytica]|uniref:SnoaL-like domain-containing protein n=1 Tax=Pelomonas cellulosilytica TaxID=2906762 RepID=A0ABS8XV84_9BURK|nr:hypothetical protein [Pelomonas sp. P8]MCE4556594.1 hypothetical protein [Pelomonas sp. P8]
MMKVLSTLSGLLRATTHRGVPAAESPDAVFDRYVATGHASDMGTVWALIAPDVEPSAFVGCRPDMDNFACLAHDVETTVHASKARFTGVNRRVDGDLLTVRGGLLHAFRFVSDFRDEQTVALVATLGIAPGASLSSPSTAGSGR